MESLLLDFSITIPVVEFHPISLWNNTFIGYLFLYGIILLIIPQRKGTNNNKLI